MSAIEVGGESQYQVVVGRDLVSKAALHLRGSARVAIVHPNSMSAVAAPLAKSLVSAGIEVLELPVPDGEEAKQIAIAEAAWDALGQAGFTRTDAIIGLGGGATTDLAGFVAGTWLRGVRVLHIPTTMLAMVDAAIGGKTGINTTAGKNLVGVFHSPSHVLCDLDLLATLPTADFRAGLAEVAKVGFIRDGSILEDLVQSPDRALDWRDDLPESLVRRAVRVKAEVVTGDFRESGDAGSIGREALNYGHTFAHAVELVEGFRWRHGDAVSVGMVFVAELARAAGILDSEAVALHRTVLSGLGLPTAYLPGRWPDLRAAMQIDKKSRGSTLRFVVLDRIGSPRILAAPDEGVLESAYEAVTA